MRVSLYLLAGGFTLLSGCQTLGTQDVTSTDSDTIANTEVAPQKPELLVLQQPQEVSDVWERIRLDMALPIPDKKLVNQYRDWYIKHPQHLELISERARPFMYLIVEELEKRNLPIEIALLPIVESAFDPFAYSHGAASGLWQFTSPMAAHFGLQMDWWYDGRRDVPAATTAALDMLEYLYDKTGNNWLYALAAYNTGEGRVLNAIKHNEQRDLNTDFWSLNLPRETQRYVPQLLALADVIKNADEYGITLAPIPNQPRVEVIDVGGQIDLALAADLAQMSIERLHKLNPGFNRWATSPEGPHLLVVPVDKADDFKQALAETDQSERVSWERYQIKSGDSIGLIAKRYHTTPQAIRSINKMKNNTIIAGKHLLIPVSSRENTGAVTVSNGVKNKPHSNRANYQLDYQVKSGDSLWKIANDHKVSVKQLISWNKMTAKDKLAVGQSLIIWTNKSGDDKTGSPVMRTVSYKVGSGDSLALIANRFSVTVHDLVRWNKLEKTKYIQPGQTLKLLVDVTQVTS